MDSSRIYSVANYNIDSNISTFTKSIIQAAKLFIPRSRRKDYKP